MHDFSKSPGCWLDLGRSAPAHPPPTPMRRARRLGWAGRSSCPGGPGGWPPRSPSMCLFSSFLLAFLFLSFLTLLIVSPYITVLLILLGPQPVRAGGSAGGHGCSEGHAGNNLFTCPFLTYLSLTIFIFPCLIYLFLLAS